MSARYFIDHSDDPTFAPGNFVTLFPENLEFDHQIRGEGNVSYQISFSATDVDDNPIVTGHDFIGPWRSYWRLRCGTIAIIAGVITPWNTKLGSDFMSVNGKTWEAFFARWQYPFDPRPAHVNDYRFPASYQNDELVGTGVDTPAGLAYQASNRDVLRILGDIISTTMNVPNRMIFDLSELSTLSGTKTNYQLSLGDTSFMDSLFNDMSELGNGFDWWIGHDLKIHVGIPYRFGDPANPAIWLTIDDDFPVVDLDFTNNGPVATHVLGRGAGLAAQTTLGRAYGYDPAQVQFTRLDQSYDFGDIRNATQLSKRTQKQLSQDLQPKHDIPLQLDPAVVEDHLADGTNFWSRFRVGRAIYIDRELIAHRIDSPQQIKSFSCKVTNEGNALVDVTLDQIYDLSYNAGSPEG